MPDARRATARGVTAARMTSRALEMRIGLKLMATELRKRMATMPAILPRNGFRQARMRRKSCRSE
jgi:hypothetical protein